MGVNEDVNMFKQCEGIIASCSFLKSSVKKKGTIAVSDNSFKTLRERVDSLLLITYKEAHLNYVITKLVERAKDNILRLIEKHKNFSEDEKKANEFMKIIRTANDILKKQLMQKDPITDEGMRLSVIKIESAAIGFKQLIESHAEIEKSLDLIAKEVENIMKALEDAEK